MFRTSGTIHLLTRLLYDACDAAVAQGASFNPIEDAELARWQTATAGVMTAWIAEMDKAGKDGQALVDDARALIARYAEE
jgi:hypothetical protein